MSRGRSRDRHGHGLRSPLFNAAVPARLNRAAEFVRLASAEFARAKSREPELLAEVVLAIDAVPPASSTEPSFGRVFPGTAHRRTHIVLYRRVIEYHSSREARPALISAVIADQVDILRGRS